MKRWVKLSLAGLAVLAALALAALLVLQSRWLRDRIRERIVAELETATGGRVELASFDFDWRKLTAEVLGLVIHGTEGAAEPPLFRARRIKVGFKVLSVVRRSVDLQSLEVDTPETHLIVYPDGRTNLPSPKLRRPRRDPVEAILDLAVKRFRVVNGAARGDLRNLPAELEGEGLRAQAAFEAAGPRYRGEVSFQRLNIAPARLRSLAPEVTVQWLLERNRVEISRVRAAWNGSRFEGRATVVDLRAPRAEFEYVAHIAIKDLTPAPGLPALRPRGTARVEGKGVYAAAAGYALDGRLEASGLALAQAGVRLDNAAVGAAFELTPRRLALRDLVVSALGGRLAGQAELREFEQFRITGKVAGFSLEELTRVPGAPRVGWSGEVSGPVEISGRLRNGRARDLEAKVRLSVAPGTGAHPLEGEITATYSQRGGRLELGRSCVATPASRAEFAGALGQRLEVTLRSKDLADFEPALSLVSTKAAPLPVKLAQGEASFQGVVAGPLESPEVRGRVAASNLVWQGRTLERIEANVVLAKDRVQVENLDLRQRRIRLSGSARAGLREWWPAPDQPISGAVNLRAPDLTELLSAAGQRLPFAGDVSAAVTLAGTVGAPAGTARVTLLKGAAFGQELERVQAQASYSAGLLELRMVAVQVAGGRVEGKAAWRHVRDDLRHGEAEFDLAAKDVRLNRLRVLQEQSPGLEGQLQGRLSGTLTVASEVRVRVLNGQVRVDGLGVEKTTLGSLLATVATGGRRLEVNVTGTLAGSAIHGSTQCTLEGHYPVQGTLEFLRLSLTTLHGRFGPPQSRQPLPFEGYLTGKVVFSGNALEPPTWRAGIDLPVVELSPRPETARFAEGADLSLRNRGPVRVDVDWKGATIRKAEWTGPGTRFSASGMVLFRSRAPWNLRLQGTMDLAALRNLEPDLTSSGRLFLDAVFRGSIQKPEVFGRAEIQDGSLYLAGLPNGLDKISAVAFLYRDRATLDRFSAECGGGKVTMSGFVGFGAPLTYYLQAQAEQVRYRDPTGASVTANASLNLTGTSERSVLGGEALITRINFNPQTDLGSLLAATAQPAPPPSRPGMLTQGVRFDVRVRTAPQARLETALTRGLQAEADLRLRGDPARPAVLGRVTVSQGEVLFFGNRYTIDSGEIDFVNPVRIEPIVKLDLQTKVRNVDVTLTLSGPITKMNVTYRSDPPLQLADIVGLLATGREPASAPGLVGARTAQSQGWEQAGASALMGQAIASPLAGRLQRFFGVSRLKIDPTISGTTGTPEARVTLEQQLSPTLTFTYITNLTRAEQQTMRVEWGLTKDWSAVALREENGLFGLDFLYKKRFK